jgi:hypothetical protein
MDSDSNLTEQMDGHVAKFITRARESMPANLSLDEVWSMAIRAVTFLVLLAEQFRGASGADKKEAVLAAAAKFYDEVIAPIDIPKVPEFLEAGLIDPILKKLWLRLVAVLVDGLVHVFNQAGWPGAAGPSQNWVPY